MRCDEVARPFGLVAHVDLYPEEVLHVEACLRCQAELVGLRRAGACGVDSAGAETEGVVVDLTGRLRRRRWEGRFRVAARGGAIGVPLGAGVFLTRRLLARR